MKYSRIKECFGLALPALLPSIVSCYNQFVLKLHSSQRIRGLLLLSLVGLLLTSAPEPTDAVAVIAFRQGDVLAADGMRGQAEEAYLRTTARRPLDPQPWRRLGDLYAAWRRPDDALDAYGQALRRGDDAAALDRSLAQLYATLGDLRRSASLWDDYVRRRPEDRGARLALARTAIQLADWERARAEMERLLAHAAPDPVVHAWLGLLLIGPEPATGLSHLQRASDDPALATALAPVFAAEHHSSTADNKAFRSALLGASFLDLDLTALGQLSEPVPNGRDRMPVEQLKNATATLALRSLLAAVYRDPGYADAYAYLGQAFDQLGWSAWAQNALRYALQLAPQSPVVQTLIGLYWDRHGAPAMARHFYEVAYKQDPDNVALSLEIAATYAAQGQYTAAEVWLLLAVEVAPDDPQVWKTLAHFYLDLGVDVEESGMAAATRLLELAPNDAQAHDLMGWAYFLDQEDALARASLTQALALDPTLASAHYHLGRLNARQGHHAQASRDYYRAARHDTDGQLTAQLERARDELPPEFRDRP
jgi:tetratricopeptide (TPR) repeat protein